MQREFQQECLLAGLTKSWLYLLWALYSDLSWSLINNFIFSGVNHAFIIENSLEGVALLYF